VTVSFLNTPNFYAVLASRLSERRPAVVVSERFCDMPGYPPPIERAVRQSYRLSDQVVVNSFHQRLNFLRRYPWMKDRVITIYNGYDLQVFRPAPNEPGHKDIHILVVASVSKYKNGLCLIRALNILNKEYGLQPSVSWAGLRVIHKKRLDYLKAMEREIDLSGLLERWRWLDQRTDIASLLHQHDVLVHPSYGEGLPNVVCEAMACGRPVILSDTLDHPRLITNGVNGYLFDWRDPDDLARVIKEFSMLSEGDRHRMGEMGRAYAELNLSLDRYVGDFERVLSRVVS